MRESVMSVPLPQCITAFWVSGEQCRYSVLERISEMCTYLSVYGAFYFVLEMW